MTSFLSRDNNALKHDANTVKHGFLRTGGDGYAEVIPLNRRNRNRRDGDICLVAHYAPLSASESTSSTINPTEMMMNYKGPLPVEEWNAI